MPKNYIFKKWKSLFPGANDYNLQFNSLAPGKFEWNFRYVIFKGILVIDAWGISCEIALIWIMNVTRLHWWSINIGSGNGLVPSLSEPMLTQICHHMASLGHNELTSFEAGRCSAKLICPSEVRPGEDYVLPGDFSAKAYLNLHNLNLITWPLQAHGLESRLLINSFTVFLHSPNNKIWWQTDIA